MMKILCKFGAATLLCLAHLGPAMALSASEVPVHRWHEFSNSKLINAGVNPCPQGDCSYSAVGRLAGITYAWSGGTYDTDRDQLVVWGGGHKDYGGNEVYAFGPLTAATPTWKRLTDPTDPPANDMPYASDGRPVSRHSQDLLAYLPNLSGKVVSKMISCGVSAYYSLGYGFNNVDLFDFAAHAAGREPWSRGAPAIGSGSAIGSGCSYNPRTKTVWYQVAGANEGGLQEYNPELNTWTRYARYDQNGVVVTAIDPTRNIFLFNANGIGIRAYDLNNPSAQPYTPILSGTDNPLAAYAPGMVYDPVNDRFLFWNGGSKIWALSIPSNPKTDTWVWSTIPLATGNTVTPSGPTLAGDLPASNPNAYPTGIYGRFRYVPSLHGVVVVSATSESVYFFKLAGASTSPAITSFFATTNPVTSGAAPILNWTIANFTGTCVAGGGWSGGKIISGSGTGTETVSPITTATNYTLTCGSAVSSLTVTVSSSTPSPTTSISAIPTSVVSGAATKLTWLSTNATSCIASGAWTDLNLPTAGLDFSVVPPTTPGTYTYSLTCSGAGGTSALKSAVITVTAPSSGTGALVSVDLISLISTTNTAQTDVVSTFGHVFKQGEVPASSTVIAKDSFGNPITPQIQVDKKANYPDGSLRHAILTAKLPSLGASETKTLSLFAAANSAAPTPVSLANLIASGFNSTVSLNVTTGTQLGIFTASAKDLLAALPTTIPAKNIWLSGQEVSEWIVGGSVKTASGTPHPHLAAYFHVRAYAGTPITKVRVDVVVENNWVKVDGPSDFAYVPTVTVGNATIYNNGGANLTHYHHARWHQVGWWNNTDPKIYVKLDTTYLQDTKAIPKYETLKPTDAFLNGRIQSTAPMTRGDQPAAMPSGGAASSIGPLPQWDAVYAVSGDRRAYNYMLANADGGAVFATHYRDENTGLPVTIDNYPDASFGDPSSSNPKIPAGTGTNPLEHDQGHQPSIGYTAYLVTGDYYYLEEMQFWSATNLIQNGSYQRGGSDAYKAYKQAQSNPTNGSTGLWYTGSTRGQAWSYRSLGQAASITPDTHPLKSYFTNKLNNNIAYDTWQYVDGKGADANNLGLMFQGGRGPGEPLEGEFSMWQDNFISWSFQYLVDLGFSNATPMRDFKAKTAIGMMGMAANEACFQWAPQYRSYVGPGNSYFATFKEVYDETAKRIWPYSFAAPNNSAPLPSSIACGTKAMADYMTARSSTQTYPHVYVVNEMDGCQNCDYYYFSPWQPALAAAAESGLPGGTTAWSRSLLSGVHPNYNDQPIWAIVPRTQNTGPGPSLVFTADATSINVGSSTTLRWNSPLATKGCVATGGSASWPGNKPTTGLENTGTLTANTAYTLTCTGDTGSTFITVAVAVVAPPITVTLNAVPTSVVSGNTTKLTWTSTNATLCQATGSWGGSKNPPSFGEEPLTLNNSTGNYPYTLTYTLTCSATGAADVSANVTVNVTQPTPTVTFITPATNSVNYNGSINLDWTSTNATSCTASGATAGGVWSGSMPTKGPKTLANLTNVGANTFTLTCSRVGGVSPPKSVTVTVGSAPAGMPTVNLKAEPDNVGYNGMTVVTWGSANITNGCTATGGPSGSNWESTNKPLLGAATFSNLTSNVSFTLTCGGASSSATQTVNVTVAPPPLEVTFTANPLTVDYKKSTTLTWTTSIAANCIGSGGWSGDKSTTSPGLGSSNLVPELTTTTTYTLSCSGANSTILKSVTVTVLPPPKPVVEFSSDESTIPYQRTTELRWKATNATTCVASGAWSGDRSVSGEATVGPLTEMRIYTLTCSGLGGDVSQSITVNVKPPVESTKQVGSGTLDITMLAWLFVLVSSRYRRARF